jgi:hypothetical protein
MLDWHFRVAHGGSAWDFDPSKTSSNWRWRPWWQDSTVLHSLGSPGLMHSTPGIAETGSSTS